MTPARTSDISRRRRRRRDHAKNPTPAATSASRTSRTVAPETPEPPWPVSSFAAPPEPDDPEPDDPEPDDPEPDDPEPDDPEPQPPAASGATRTARANCATVDVTSSLDCSSLRCCATASPIAVPTPHLAEEAAPYAVPAKTRTVSPFLSGSSRRPMSLATVTGSGPPGGRMATLMPSSVEPASWERSIVGDA